MIKSCLKIKKKKKGNKKININLFLKDRLQMAYTQLAKRADARERALTSFYLIWDAYR